MSKFRKMEQLLTLTEKNSAWTSLINDELPLLSPLKPHLSTKQRVKKATAKPFPVERSLLITKP